MNNIKSILAFDLDGTLTPRNQLHISPKGLPDLLNQLTAMGHLVIPVTGKPASYVSQLFPINSLTDSGIIAENAGVFRRAKQQNIEVYGSSMEEMKKMRDLLQIGFDHVNVTNIIIKGISYEVAIDPGDVSILTVFTNASYVAHRWTFNQSITADELVEKLGELITENGCDNYLAVLPSFPDGGVQLIRKNSANSHPIDKSSLIQVLHSMYPHIDKVRIAMFGDGHNDIPAMKPDGVIPLTFSNAHEDVVNFIKTTNGYISPYEAPQSYGVVDGIYWLTTQSFFGQDENLIKKAIRSLFPKYTYSHTTS